MIQRRSLFVSAGMMMLVYLSPARAAEPPQKAEGKKPASGKFLRVERNDKGVATTLETAVVRYVPAKGQGELTVDLIAAVHIGDADYYRQLNRIMKQYDVLLYELVAPPGTRIPKGGKRDSSNPVATMQKIMKFVLDLESQTEKIDYTRKNFVHADLSAEKMGEAIRDRGDDGLTITLGVAADMLRQQNLRAQGKQPEARKKEKEEEADLDIASVLLEPDGAMKLKRVMAEQFEKAEAGLGPTLNTILITDRNKACMKVFQKELAKGKKKIGIFYGAAHMPDFEKRLREDFGLKRDREEWLSAWDMESKQRDVLIDVLKLLAK